MLESRFDYIPGKIKWVHLYIYALNIVSIDEKEKFINKKVISHMNVVASGLIINH